MSSNPTDRIIVAGGGPTGLIAALSLAKQDIPVLLLEQQEAPQDHRRATTFHPPTLEYLDELGMIDAVLDDGRITPVWQFRDRHTGVVAEFDLSALKDETKYPYRVQCEQMELNRALYKTLADHPNVEIRFSHEVLGAEQDGDSATVRAKTPDGEENFAGRYVFGADGSRSNIRRALGVGFDGFTYDEKVVQYGTTFDVSEAMPDIAGVAYISDPDEWCVILHLPEYWRVTFSARDGEADDVAVRDDVAEARMAAFFGKSGAVVELHRNIWAIHQRVAEDLRKGRIIIGGDAAHINSPMGGMGMNSGVHDAVNFADKMGQIWRGEADESLLDRYTRQRRHVALEDVRLQTIRNTKFIAEKDADERLRNQDEMRAIAEDPRKSYGFMMGSSMIAGLRAANALD
ncbi:MAG: FAD-dependent monooxygenase [Rhodospirillaceae bacterium]|jgi:3-(3-hydroxy-phenyl)propionate hydroxylase|nr:FAD-dependent monooxygenase [Rhodospirillaceae bacterium]MBT3810352.1 FAD-dependent monooxygenase [Rhodospirillaceae bacterium]MBT3930035.1 FAD-dependent monooxygenase [Rhodospirillaceae bacterium]MBT4774054.1 FAD-dependent monooxygenase [Rhodospirillaceae bacterium]MBT5358617.1 FAD-dependent monooxygenase [Rhodospirillaceae bacterium]